MNKNLIHKVIKDAIIIFKIGNCHGLCYALYRSLIQNGVNPIYCNMDKHIPEFTKNNYVKFCKDNNFTIRKENNLVGGYWDSDKRTLESDTRRIEFLKYILKNYES